MALNIAVFTRNGSKKNLKYVTSPACMGYIVVISQSQAPFLAMTPIKHIWQWIMLKSIRSGMRNMLMYKIRVFRKKQQQAERYQKRYVSTRRKEEMMSHCKTHAKKHINRASTLHRAGLFGARSGSFQKMENGIQQYSKQ